jgi:DNA-binding transcriptional MerR regulator
MPDGSRQRDGHRDSAGTAKSGEAPTYTIGELAEEFGLTLRAIRFYEDEGLITPTRAGQARIFTRRDRAKLQLIMRGKRLGFSIAEIRDFLHLYSIGDMQVEQVRYVRRKARERIDALERQLADVQETLVELRQIDRAIGEHLVSQGLPADDAGAAEPPRKSTTQSRPNQSRGER